MNITTIAIDNIDYKVEYEWNAFVCDVLIYKINDRPDPEMSMDKNLYSTIRSKVLMYQMEATRERREFNEEMKEEEERYPNDFDKDPMIDNIE